MNDSDLVRVLVRATTVFAVTKVLFGLIGWYTAIGEDRIYRRHLDRLHDTLHKDKIGNLASRFFRRFYVRSRHMWFIDSAACWRFVGLSFFVNLTVTTALFVATVGFPTILKYALPLTCAILIFNAATGAVLDVLFGIATLKHLKATLAAGKAVNLWAFVVADIAVAAFATYMNLLVATFTTAIIFRSPVPLLDARWLTGTLETLVKLSADSPGPFVLFCLGASLPTATYLALGAMVVVARATPLRLQEFAKRLVFAVATDEKPVFSQLGTALGSLGAVIAALITWLGS